MLLWIGEKANVVQYLAFFSTGHSPGRHLFRLNQDHTSGGRAAFQKHSSSCLIEHDEANRHRSLAAIRRYCHTSGQILSTVAWSHRDHQSSFSSGMGDRDDRWLKTIPFTSHRLAMCRPDFIGLDRANSCRGYNRLASLSVHDRAWSAYTQNGLLHHDPGHAVKFNCTGNPHLAPPSDPA